MRIIFVVCFLLASNAVHSQNASERFIDSIATELKKQSITNAKDWRVFSLLNKFYEEVLQSDIGLLSGKTVSRIQEYNSKKHLKNRHLLFLFYMYQQLVTEAAEKGTKPDPAAQLAYINKLEQEMLAVYNKVPVIIYIYKAEALASADRKQDEMILVEETLKKFPDSVPLKVYRYLDTKDEQLKTDLTQNHSQHWMVRQNHIGS